MEKPNMEKIKMGIWSAIGGAILTMIIGFSWGGWVFGSTALNKGKEMAQVALTDRLTPICVAQFNMDPEKEDKFNILKAKSRWEKEDYVMEQGWSTMPFEKKPDSFVADQCFAMILKNGQQVIQ